MKHTKRYIQRACIYTLITLCLLLASCTEANSNKKNIQLAPKLGVCTSLNNAEMLKACGYDYVEEGVRRYTIPTESDEKFAEKFAAFQKSPLPIEACNSFLPGSLKSTGPEIKHDEILDFAQIAFKRAKQTGIKMIVFGSGGSRRIPDGFDPAEARKQFVSLLKRMGPIAARYDVTVVIEPLNKKECNFINLVSEATDIAREVNHPNIQVLADFYHMAMEKEGADSILKAGNNLKHCHIAELKNRAAPGTHGFDFTGYLKALKEINYKGRISIECRWKDIKKQAPIAMQAIKEQIRQVNALP